MRWVFQEEEKRQKLQSQVWPPTTAEQTPRQTRLLTNIRRHGFTFVPEADVYPLVLSVGIFIQSLIFSNVQSTGLDSFFGLGCTWLAQLMLPGKLTIKEVDRRQCVLTARGSGLYRPIYPACLRS